jgi:hydrogenase/urease accessory protein HupE
MTRLVVPLAAFVLLLAAEPALAHPPPLGFRGVLGGILHPLFVPAHLLAVLGLGLLIGQREWSRTVALVFIAGLAVGLGVMTFGFVPAFLNEVVLALALILGLLVALTRPLPEAAGAALATLVGFCVALDSPPEVVSVREANLMLIGTGFGATLLIVIAVEAASRLRLPWARIAARILGSWIAASAILVLAIRLVR